MSTQGGGSRPKPRRQASGETFLIQNCEKIHFCCLSRPVCGVWYRSSDGGTGEKQGRSGLFRRPSRCGPNPAASQQVWAKRKVSGGPEAPIILSLPWEASWRHVRCLELKTDSSQTLHSASPPWVHPRQQHPVCVWGSPKTPCTAGHLCIITQSRLRPVPPTPGGFQGQGPWCAPESPVVLGQAPGLRLSDRGWRWEAPGAAWWGPQ